MAKQMYENKKVQDNCVTIVVCTKKSDNKDRKLGEINRLAQSSGLNVVASFSQNIKDFSRATVLGSGKLQEIKCEIEGLEEKVSVVIVDYALTGSQMKNIADALGIRVLDRVGLIIDIFATRALSSEAKLQVKYAQDRYLLPRLKEYQGTSGRYGGAGVGMRGPGESKLELDRRKIESEMARIKKEIQKAKTQRQVTKRSRENSGIPRIALVGYTNAGKSSLLNLLTKEQIYADDRLFATLDTTSRKLFLGDGKSALLTDTVGFISDLPHELIDAFSSTLEEAQEADLILHVVDVSMTKNIDGEKEYLKNIQVTDEVLKNLNCTDNRILVLNKADILKEPILLEDNQILISTKTGKGIDKLMSMIKERI